MEIIIKDHDELLMTKVRKARELREIIAQGQESEELQRQLSALKQEIADHVIEALNESCHTLDLIDSMKSFRH